MNGANIGTFDLAVPADTESMGLTDDRIRSVKSTFQQALNDEHVFPTTGGSAVGYHRYGAARTFYGAQSLVSSSGTEGRLMLTSDTSKLFAVGSGGTVFIGGSQVISVGTNADTAGGRHNWVEYFGAGMTDSGGNISVTFPDSGFSGIPYFFASLATNNASSGGAYGISAFAVSATIAKVQVWQTDTLASVQSAHVVWRSLGTRVM